MTLTYSPLLFPLLAWLFSLGGTAVALAMLRQYAVMDNPNARSNHKAPVPRGGGIAMIIVALLFLACYGVDIRIILAATLLAAISFADDLRGVPAYLRFGIQALAAIIAVPALHGRALSPQVPLLIEQAITVLCWIWFINLNNFMDGIDGISSMQAIMVAVGICFIAAAAHTLLPLPLVMEASIVAAATLGFFWFNRHPAKLFMGDVGSITLGFLVFYLLAILAQHGALFSALILPAYYVSDATFTLLKRFARGEKVWQAHSEHAYQQAVRRGLTHTQVVHKITMLNFCLVILAIFATLNMITGMVMMVVGYMLTAWLIRHLMHKRIS